MGNQWETYGKPIGNLWETYGKPMGNQWETINKLNGNQQQPHHPHHPRQRLKEGSTARRYALAKALQHQTGVQTNPPVGCGSARRHLPAESILKHLQIRIYEVIIKSCYEVSSESSMCPWNSRPKISKISQSPTSHGNGPPVHLEGSLKMQTASSPGPKISEDLGLQNCWSLWISTWRISIRKTQWMLRMLMTYQCMFTIIIKK